MSRSTAAVRSTVAMLAAAVFINYFDRGNLATAAPLLTSDLQLTALQMGVLFSAFFWSYAPLQPIAGWLAQRFPVRYVLAGGLTIWAVATLLTGIAHGFLWLLVCRVLLGLGESVNYPCNAQYVASYVTLGARSRANGLIAVGQALGPTTGTLLGGCLMAGIGWRYTFVIFGIASLLWLLPWWRITQPTVGPVPRTHQDAVSYRQLLSQRALWATSVGHFCGNYAFYFMLTWLPLLLVKQYGLSVATMASVAAGVYALQACAALASGYVCDWFIERGVQPGDVWRRVMTASLCAVALAMAGCISVGIHGLLLLLAIAGIFFGAQSAPLGAITQTLGGSRAAGQWMGIQNLCANVAGVTAPLLTGFVVDYTGQFSLAFAVAAAVTALGAFTYARLLGPVTAVDWSKKSYRDER